MARKSWIPRLRWQFLVTKTAGAFFGGSGCRPPASVLPPFLASISGCSLANASLCSASKKRLWPLWPKVAEEDPHEPGFLMNALVSFIYDHIVGTGGRQSYMII